MNPTVAIDSATYHPSYQPGCSFWWYHQPGCSGSKCGTSASWHNGVRYRRLLIGRMRIVTYNVNGLRARLSSSRSLRSFLDSLDADVVCLQETKLSRQELSADLAIASGYESFFSCTRTVKKGRIGYSGVATFCRVGDGVNALPLAADEGFTGLLHCSKPGHFTSENGRVGCYEDVWNMSNISVQELLLLDSEGRCVVTDHGSFVLFNIYGPRVQHGDSDRLQFKLDFFRALQCRWEGLLRNGRSVIAVGDFNIAPFPIDSCDPGPEFEQNPPRMWLRAQLHSGGGPFVDIFRQLQPWRKEAYSCWSQASGAEEFNFGSRIDLILVAGPCSHSDISGGTGLHSFAACEVEACDILLQHKRAKTDSLPRWAGGRSLKLEGSDHAPVYVKLRAQPSIPQHDVPPLAARFMPELRGRQQSIVSLLQRNANAIGGNAKPKHVDEFERSSEPIAETDIAKVPCLEAGVPAGTLLQGEHNEQQGPDVDDLMSVQHASASKPELSSAVLANCGYSRGGKGVAKGGLNPGPRKLDGQKVVQSSLQSFFSRAKVKGLDKFPVKDEHCSEPQRVETAPVQQANARCCVEAIAVRGEAVASRKEEFYLDEARSRHSDTTEIECRVVTRMRDEVSGASVEETKVGAAAEWQRIQKSMAANVPMCKGHGEPCVSRQVKKAGPNIGRGFYVCARAQGPASNPEARCDHFEWASMKGRRKRVLGQD